MSNDKNIKTHDMDSMTEQLIKTLKEEFTQATTKEEADELLIEITNLENSL